ncbi:MAG: hypothetical protein NWF04_00085 [Candidatus Bathyarchaeota archaeon]|nr:hypothetical protein [Candidatus Bathyarchaeota archaeon]
MSTSDQILKEISDKIDKLLRLQAIEIVREIPEEKGKIELLDSLGFRPVDIAKFLNKTPENIYVVLSTIRKKKSVNNLKLTKKTTGEETILVPENQNKKGGMK